MSDLRIIGRIHPPAAPGGKMESDDLTSAEIATTNLGRSPVGGDSSYVPVLVEHEGGPVGMVDATWKGGDGSLKMAARIKDPHTKELVRNGNMRGLSIGSALHHDPGADPSTRYLQTLNEVSVCERPRRAGCYIEEMAINGFDYKPCLTVANASVERYPQGKPTAPPSICHYPIHP